MTCAACVNSLESVLNSLDGVVRASVTLVTKSGKVEYDPKIINQQDIIEAIEDAGLLLLNSECWIDLLPMIELEWS